jgi:hypothetical protein
MVTTNVFPYLFDKQWRAWAGAAGQAPGSAAAPAAGATAAAGTQLNIKIPVVIRPTVYYNDCQKWYTLYANSSDRCSYFRSLKACFYIVYADSTDCSLIQQLAGYFYSL